MKFVRDTRDRSKRPVAPFMMRRALLVLALALAVANGKKRGEPVAEQAKSFVSDLIDKAIMPAFDATYELLMDCVSYLLSLPVAVADVYVWAIKTARACPSLAMNVINGDAATLNSFSSFASSTASIIFCTYVALTALNLMISLFVDVKDYFADSLTLPTSLPGVKKLPGPVMDVRNFIQKQCLDRIKSFTIKGWIIPLEGQSGHPSLAQALPVLASATSVAVLLGCAPGIQTIVEKGADKNAAESLAYTLGMAMGLHYLAKRV